MPAQVCKPCARANRLTFKPCPKHSVPVPPTSCDHTNTAMILIENRTGCTVCLDCKHVNEGEEI